MAKTHHPKRSYHVWADSHVNGLAHEPATPCLRSSRVETTLHISKTHRHSLNISGCSRFATTPSFQPQQAAGIRPEEPLPYLFSPYPLVLDVTTHFAYVHSTCQCSISRRSQTAMMVLLSPSNEQRAHRSLSLCKQRIMPTASSHTGVSHALEMMQS